MRHRRPLFVSLVLVAAWLAPALVMAQAPPPRAKRCASASSVCATAPRPCAGSRSPRRARSPSCTRTATSRRRGARPGARAELLRAIRDAAADGLDPQDITGPLRSSSSQTETGQPRRVRGGVARLRPAAERRGRPAALSPLCSAKVNPARRESCSGTSTARYHRGPPAQFLQSVIDAPPLYAEVEREKPQYAMYRNLRAELAHYRELRARGGWRLYSRRGRRSNRVRAILGSQRSARGSQPPVSSSPRPARAASTSSSFDDSVVAAVRAFQNATRDRAPTAAVGAGTLARAERPDRRAQSGRSR